ncbi:pilus assembly protein, partial [Acinetobacter baumannii]
MKAFLVLDELNQGEFKHEVRQFQKPYDNQQAEQISLM